MKLLGKDLRRGSRQSTVDGQRFFWLVDNIFFVCGLLTVDCGLLKTTSLALHSAQYYDTPSAHRRRLRGFR